MIKRIFALSLCTLMLFALAPLALAKTETGASHAAEAGMRRPAERAVIPADASYNANDYQKVLIFLEQTDEQGVKNGTKLNPDYDPADPETWVQYDFDEYEGTYIAKGVTFWAREDDVCSLDWIKLDDLDLAGYLDLIGCESLQSVYVPNNRITSVRVTNCFSLIELFCGNNLIDYVDYSACSELVHVDVSNNEMCDTYYSSFYPKLYSLDVSGNHLEKLQLSDNAMLQVIRCSDNQIRSLSVYNCPIVNELIADNNRFQMLDLFSFPKLEYVSLLRNPLKYLDLTGCTQIPTNAITTSGRGSFEYYRAVEFDFLYNPYTVEHAEAHPDAGAEFLGWFADDGSEVCGEPYADLESIENTDIVAIFGDALIPGDADRNGTVDTTDALIVLRAALGITEAGAGLFENCDMDGNGIIDTTDALMILRTALGIAK